MELLYHRSENPFYLDKDVTDGYLAVSDSGLPLIRYHSLDALDWLTAVCTTRLGGVSTGCLSELNLGFSRGDRPENVERNYRRVMKAIGAEFGLLALTQQVHETVIRYVDRNLTVGEGFKRKITCTDGLYTDRPGIVLSATFADCVPIYVADRVHHRIALVHSGWRGTAGEISAGAVKVLQDLGSDPRDLTAVIGPCISGDHYEVTGDVIEALAPRFAPESMRDIAVRTDETHWLCDLPAACWHTLRKAGLREEDIHFSGFCTWENDRILYSHRKSGGRRGNFNAFMGIRSN